MAKEKVDKLAEMRRQYGLAKDYAAPLYDKARDDIRFSTVPGEQWDAKLKARRGDRPCYEFPKIQGHVRQVVNEMRQARPQGKVRGTQESDVGLAELMQGICRNIESVSNADQAYDIAFESAVKGGFGVWRICTDYSNPDDFDLDIFIRPIRNAFSVKFDPAAMEIDRRDANYAFVEEFMPKSDFVRQFPDADITGFEADDECSDWRDAEKVRYAEYLYKTPMKRELWALSNNDTVWADEAGDEEALAANGIQITKKRTIDTHKVYSRLTNGHEWLTDETEIPCKFIPLVPVWGNIANIDGEDYWQGMVREAKDQQRLHNVHRTAMIEAVAKAPKAPFLLKMKWIKGLEHFWNRANAEDFPYLPVNDAADGIPERAKQAEVPAALIQMANMDNDDMKATTGQYDASLGSRSNETSGVAIGQRKQQGATATFHYMDNLSYAMRYTYEILVDMVPQVIDTPRVVRILGEDGGEKWKQLYQEVTDPQTGQKITLNDISKGKYDVSITVGPSYATQRMEAVDAFAQLAGQIGSSFPAIGPLLAYQVISNLDLPGSEEVSTALRKQLVQQGLMEPKEGDPPPQQQPPDPRIDANVKKILSEVDKNQAVTAKTMAEAQAVTPQAAAGIDKADAEADRARAQAGRTHAETAIHSHQAMSGALNMPLVPPVHPQPIPPQGWSLGSDITGQ